MFIIFLNIFFILLYVFNFDLPQSSALLDILYLLFFLCLISLFFYKFKFFELLKNIHLSFLVIILSFLFTEIIFAFFPSMIPKDLTIWMDKEKKENILVTEILEESPFVKFKPNTNIKTRFYRGNADQFVYEWKTDKNGFKNEKSLEKLSTFKIVAIGNSFTEGMGVKIEDTFTSYLNKKGYSSYNLGVQGYSMTQAKGTLKKYGLNLKPEIIICVYTKSTYSRNKFFTTEYRSKNKKYTGGIQSIKDADMLPEVRANAKFTTSALWLYSKFLRKNLKNFFSSKKFNEKIFNKYPTIQNAIFEQKKPNEQDWNLLIKDLIEIKQLSDTISAKLILVYIEGREMTYYERATNKKLPDNIFYERKLLKNFSSENKITFLDMGLAIRDYVNNLPKGFKLNDLPYLELDGHFSRIGNQILSKNIINIINE